MRFRDTVFLLTCVLLLAPNRLEAQTYTYDAAGRLIRVAYADGKGVAYTYDAADNLSSAIPVDLPRPPTSITATRATPTEVRVTWVSTATDSTGFAIMRKPLTGGDWIQIALVSGSVRQFADTTVDPAIDYVYRIATRNNVGPSAYSAEIRTTSNASIPLVVESGGARTLTTLATAPVVRTGYAIVEVDDGSTPYGTAVFRLTQNGVTVSEAAVPASPPAKRTRIFIEYRTNLSSPSGQFQGTLGVNTGFAMVNTGSSRADITYTLRNGQGQPLSSGIGIMEAGEHVARFINELSGVAAGFTLPLDFDTAVSFATLDIESNLALSVMALRLTSNQRNEVLFTSTPVADLSAQPTPGDVSFPQLVDGGGYSTSVVLLNTSNQLQSGRLELRDNAGAPLPVKNAAGATAASFDLVIPANGLAVFETDGSPASVRVGWVRWISSPGSGTPVGAGVFRLAQGGIVVTESGIPSATPSSRVRIFIDKTGGYDTGVAISNPGAAASTISVRAYGLDGKSAVGAPGVIPLAAGAHEAKLSGELIPELPDGFTGVMEFSAPSPFVALTLRILTNARGESLFTTFPVADQTRPAPQPIVFPQLADGNGFQTEFILLGPVSSSSSAVRFLDDQGRPLPVGKLPF